jgi:hypothetical protein
MLRREARVAADVGNQERPNRGAPHPALGGQIQGPLSAYRRARSPGELYTATGISAGERLPPASRQSGRPHLPARGALAWQQHLTSARRKLGARSTAQAIAIATRRHIITSRVA